MFSAVELLATAALLAWVVLVVAVISRAIYKSLEGKRGREIASYYSRKTTHILAGGPVTALAAITPVYSTPLLPSLVGASLAAAIYLPRKLGRLPFKFQDPDNLNEVSFCLSWSVTLALGWLAGLCLSLSNPFSPAALPLLYVSIGDGVTGFVRGEVVGRRSKHWSGNVAMFATCSLLALLLGYRVSGVLSALVASLVEHVDCVGGVRVDDNVTIPLASLATLLLLSTAGVP